MGMIAPPPPVPRPPGDASEAAAPPSRHAAPVRALRPPNDWSLWRLLSFWLWLD